MYTAQDRRPRLTQLTQLQQLSNSSSPQARKPLTPLQNHNQNLSNIQEPKGKGSKITPLDHEMVGKTKTATTSSHATRKILTRKPKRELVEKATMTDADLPDPDLNVNVKGPAPAPEDDLINGKPSTEYWMDIAEERRVALAQALQENKELIERVEKLEADNKSMEEMLGEAKALADMLNTLAEEGADESGIGLGGEVDD